MNLSLILFTITTALFFSLTESTITLCIMYLLCFSVGVISTIQQSKEKLTQISKNKITNVITTSVYIGMIGIITHNYIITVLGTILTGYYYTPNKSDTNTNAIKTKD